MPGTSLPPDAIVRINEQLADLLDAMAAATPTTEPVAIGIVWRNSGVLTVSVGIPPAFSDHPDDITVDQGDTAAFSVTASNATSYQWQKQESGAGAWANVSGATSSSYTTGALTYAADNTDKYRCVATGPGGSTTSNSATLTVNEPITVSLIFDDNFTIDRAAPLPNNNPYAASGAGTTLTYLVTGTTAAITGGQLVFGNATTILVTDGAAARSRLAGRIHYIKHPIGTTTDFLEWCPIALVADSGPTWWATYIGRPRINIKVGGPTSGSIRSDDGDSEFQGFSWQSKITENHSYEWAMIERTSGTFSLLNIDGAGWRIITFEKASTTAGKMMAKNNNSGVTAIDRMCTANTSFTVTPLVQHSFASVTGPSDGSGQSETGGSGLAATTAGSVTISGSALQMSADSTGSVVFETGETEIAIAADFTIYDGSPCGLILRYQDASNYLIVRINSTDNSIAIVEVVAGSETTLVILDSDTGQDSYDLANAASTIVQAHIDGNLIRARYYGPLHDGYVEWTTTRFAAATKAGVFVSKGSGVNSAKASNLVVFAQAQSLPEMTNT